MAGLTGCKRLHTQVSSLLKSGGAVWSSNGAKNRPSLQNFWYKVGVQSGFAKFGKRLIFKEFFLSTHINQGIPEAPPKCREARIRKVAGFFLCPLGSKQPGRRMRTQAQRPKKAPAMATLRYTASLAAVTGGPLRHERQAAPQTPQAPACAALAPRRRTRTGSDESARPASTPGLRPATQRAQRPRVRCRWRLSCFCGCRRRHPLIAGFLGPAPG